MDNTDLFNHLSDEEIRELLSPAEERIRGAFTDLHNAKILAEALRETAAYTTEWGWMVWRGKLWLRDQDDALVNQLAGNVLTEHYLRRALEDMEKRKKLTQDALKAHSRSVIANAVYLARGELKAEPEAFDPERNHLLLNTPSGVVNLETGELLPHNPGLKITKITGAPYDPQADCPLFRTFLEQIFPDRDLILFVQRLLGYCIIGGNPERVFIVFWGVGANGKSTLIETVSFILGSYAAEIPSMSLTPTKYSGGGEPRPDLAMLPGVRLLTACETKQQIRLDEALIKQLTGGDRITVRHLHKPFFSFKPQFTPLLRTTFKPLARGDDQAFWDRVLLVPFERRFEKEKWDRQLGEKLKAEAPGILCWLVEGVKLYVKEGLALPTKVEAATTEYRGEADPLWRFITEAVENDPTATVPAKKLYEAYTRWCQSEGIEPVSQTKFGIFLTNIGVKKVKERRANCYVGLQVQEAYREIGEEEDFPF